MKRLLLLLCLAASVSVSAQVSFTDDFESYNVNDYLALNSTEWTTWSGTPGGADDAMIVDDNASSGSNSIHMFSTTSGPQDLVLPFQGEYNTGTMQFEMMMFIESASDAYFNFQANQTIGEVWAMECVIEAGGTYQMYNTNGNLAMGNVPMNQWFKMEFNINLNTNEWQVIIDNVLDNTFSNSINQISALNLYATVQNAAQASYWIDDVSYSHTGGALPDRNGAVTAVSGLSGLATQSRNPVVEVRNLGNDPITSFDVEIDYQGNQITESVTGVNMASLDIYNVEFSSGIQLVSGASTLTATISNVNGSGADEDPSDDTKSITVDPLVPAPNKKVFVEEATGTWCGWCPRGTVAMANMQEEYPEFFIGAAVHNNDPMADETYDAGLGALINGYPSAVVDRGSDIDPSVIEGDFLQRIVIAPKGLIDVEATLDSSGSVAYVHVDVTLNEAISNQWKVAVVLVEDSVTGSGSDWGQANYYSGGGNGELTGAGKQWHNEPGTVPASEMVYDHVARSITPGFLGMNNSFPAMTAMGDTFDFDFEVDIAQGWNVEHMHAVAIIIDESGVVDNAEYSVIEPFAPDEPDGLFEVSNSNDFKVYPNPSNGQVWIESKLLTSEARLVIRDITGKVVQNNLSSSSMIGKRSADLSALPNGLYLIEIQSEKGHGAARILKH